jgi:FO synthase
MSRVVAFGAGAEHGEELPPDAMEKLIASLGRTARIRTTLYGDAGTERHDAAHAAKALAPITLEVAERWTGSLSESEQRRVLPKPRQPARVR